jgi:acyl carrier protein
MTELTTALRDLRELPQSDRLEALEALVVTQFRSILLLADSDEFRVDGSFFDLGLTSLRLLEIKQNLEELLGIGIDATVLFNRPTVEQLIGYLSEVVSEQSERTA